MPDEKFDEKEMEKREEKVNEKEEKQPNDRLGAIVWALILIWAGVVWLLHNAGLLENIPFVIARLPWEMSFISTNAWAIFFLGAAAILLLEILLRLILPEYRRNVTGTFIVAVVFIALAVGRFDVLWPIIIIVIGLSILANAFMRRSR